jgi:hypothetical protein
MSGYLDLHELPEDRRITRIGQEAMKGGVIAFCVDDDPGKADRYARKLLERFPDLEEVERFNGPVAGVVTVKVQKRAAE